MSIWSATIIPVFAVIFLLMFFKHHTKWWEFAIPFAVSLMLIGGFKMLGEYSATKDSEIWGGWVVEVRYFEDWNEYIHQTCTRTLCSGSGSNRSCHTTTYDCSYVRYHPEYWDVVDSNEEVNNVTKDSYLALVKKFLPLGGKPTFVDMRRNYHTDDGDMYKAIYPGDTVSLEPVTTKHSYENRVQASRSVFNYQHIGDEEAIKTGLFEYPKATLFDYPSILGSCGDDTKEANKRLRIQNALLGKAKELRMWVICTSSSDPAFGQLQESYWVGGNKNEVVLVIGNGWRHAFSWSDHKEAIIAIRDFQGGVVESVDFMARTLKASFKRKNFDDFNYLTVETPTWAVIVTFIVTLLTNVGVSYWVIINEHS